MVSQHEVPYLKTVVVPNPAVGTDFVITGPGQGIWRIAALQFTYTASAAVANRRPHLVWATGDGDVANTPVVANITAGQVVILSTFDGLAAYAGAGTAQMLSSPSQGFVLLPGWTLRSATTNIDVGDQISLIRALVVEYPTGPTMRQTPDVYAIIEESG